MYKLAGLKLSKFKKCNNNVDEMYTRVCNKCAKLKFKKIITKDCINQNQWLEVSIKKLQFYSSSHIVLNYF